MIKGKESGSGYGCSLIFIYGGHKHETLQTFK